MMRLLAPSIFASLPALGAIPFLCLAAPSWMSSYSLRTGFSVQISLNNQIKDFLLCLFWFFMFRCLYHALLRLRIKRDGLKLVHQSPDADNADDGIRKEQQAKRDTKHGWGAASPGIATEDVEWCTYVISTVHAAVAVSGSAAFLLADDGGPGGPWWAPARLALGVEEEEEGEGAAAAARLRLLFDFSLAYFASDALLMVRHRLAGWGVLTAHHLCAALPYAAHALAPGCGRLAPRVLAAFLLVEGCTLPLNLRWFLERGGGGGKGGRGPETDRPPPPRGARWALYATVASWVPLRLVLPTHLLWALHTAVLPAWWEHHAAAAAAPSLPATPGGGGGGAWAAAAACAVPSAAAAHLIALFCAAAFFGKFLPEARAAWAAAAAAAAAPAKEGKGEELPAAAAAALFKGQRPRRAADRDEAPSAW